MLPISLVLFALAALLGALAAVRHFGRKAPSLPLALIHGVFAASGLIVLLAALLRDGFRNVLPISLGSFIVAALGGFTLFALHLRRGKLLTPLVLLHAMFAVLGFVILGAFLLSGMQ